MDTQAAAHSRRHRISSRSPRDPSAIASEREKRRRRTLRALLAGTAPDEVTHEWLATKSGIPLPYLQWRYPTIGDLVRTLEGA